MRKGKFGIVLCFYPILAFIAVILKQPFLCALLFLFAAFLEKDEWTGRQTSQALMVSLVVSFFSSIVPWATGWVSLPFFSSVLYAVSTVLSIIAYLAAIVFCILGIIRVSKEQEANLPLLSDLAYRIYGQRKPKPAPAPGQYPPPYGSNQPGQAPSQYGAPQQPYPGPQAGSQQPGSPQGNAPQTGGTQGQ